MKQVLNGITILYIICFVVCQSSAQSIPVFFKQYTSKEGLPSNHITTVAQDTSKYVWVGTSTGLARFDGVNFSQKNNIVNKDIIKIISDKNGEVWVSTYPYGINKYNPISNNFSDYSIIENKKSVHFITTRLVDKKGRIWIGAYDENHNEEEGWYLCDNNNIPIKKYTFCTDQEKQQRYNNAKITACMEREDGTFWLTTWNDIIHFNPEDGSYKKINCSSFQSGPFLKTSIYEDRNGILWLGTWAYGIIRYDINKNEWKVFKYIDTKIPEGTKNIVKNIIPKCGNELWVASYKGLLIFNSAEEKYHTLTDFKQNNNTPINAAIECMIKDDDGNIWCGSTDEGLIYIPAVQFKIKNYVAKNILDISGKIGSSKTLYDFDFDCYIRLTSYCGYIYIYDRKTGTEIRTNTPDIKYASYTHFMDAKKISKGKYLVLSSTNFYILDLYNNTLKTAAECGLQIPWDSDQQLYYTFFKGDTLVMLKNKSVVLYDIKNRIKNELAFPKNYTNIFTKSPYNYYLDNSNRFWFFDANQHCYVFEIENKNLQLLTQISLQSQGFYGLTSVNKSEFYAVDFTHFFKINLANNKIDITEIAIPKNIVFNKMIDVFLLNNELWITSEISIIKYNLETKQFSNYNNDSYLGGIAYCTNYLKELNELAITTDGKFSVLSLNNNPWDAKKNISISLDNFKVNNQYYKTEKDINYLQKIELDYAQNFLSVDFAALTFNQSPQTEYLYKLDGIDDNWNIAGKDHRASYTSLPPGNYTLKFKAYDNGFGWKSIEKNITISITPPFWQTWWFYLLILILVSSIIYMLFKWRFSQVRKEEKLKSEFEKKMAETEMVALRAQMNPHFIFNCLNSINGYIVKNDPFSASDYLSKFSKLIRLILDNSRQTKIPLQSELDAINIYIEMESLRFSNKFEYEIILDEEIDTFSTKIPPMILQPFVENAIWHGLMHSNNPGKLKIKITQEESCLMCVIEDNGVGRKKASERKIADPLKNQSHGMNITVERIKQAYPNAKIIITDLYDENTNATGTSVLIKLPV